MSFLTSLKFINKSFVRQFSRHVVLNNCSKLPQDQKKLNVDQQSDSNHLMAQSKHDSKHGFEDIVKERKTATENIVSNIITDPIISIEQSVYDFDVKNANKKLSDK